MDIAIEPITVSAYPIFVFAVSLCLGILIGAIATSLYFIKEDNNDKFDILDS